MGNNKIIIEGDGLKPYQEGNSWTYCIPFTLSDPDYGRIEVHLCPIRAPRTDKIGKLIFTFYQTKDQQLCNKEFHILCPPTEGLGQFTKGNGKVLGGFFACVWRMVYCQYHKTFAVMSYPPNGASKLKLSVLSSGVVIYYE